MIYVRVEMWPHGNRERARVLGEATLANVPAADGARTPGIGHYEVRLLKSPEYAKPGNVGAVWKRGRVEGFPRQRLGPWDLLLRALAVTVGYRNRLAVDEAPVEPPAPAGEEGA